MSTTSPSAYKILNDLAEQGLVKIEEKPYKLRNQGRRLLSDKPPIRTYKIFSLTEKGQEAALLVKKIKMLLGETS